MIYPNCKKEANENGSFCKYCGYSFNNSVNSSNGNNRVNQSQNNPVPKEKSSVIYLPGEKYAFDYVACEDSTLMTLNYQTEEDIAEAVMSTPAIAPVIATASMEFTRRMLETLAALGEAATSLCKEIKYNYNDYKFLCMKLQMTPAQFSFVENLPVFEPSGLGLGWEAEVCRVFCG